MRLYQDGQSEAATAIFDRYVERLLALARRRIGQKLKRRFDPEDVVQSAYRSFFVHAKNEEYQLARSGDLWRLLASITLNKLYRQIEKQTAAKRSVKRETPADNSLAAEVPDPSAAECVGVIEQMHLAIKGLSTDERLVLTAWLQGQPIGEISESIGKSGANACRLMARARQRVEQRLLGDPPAAVRIGGSNESADLEQAPLQYSDYVLEQLLGSGGMGKIFRATEKSTGRTVAIKAAA